MKCKFFPVYSIDLIIIGEVKYDPFRVHNKWTALNKDGRIKDCKTREEAEELVLKGHQK